MVDVVRVYNEEEPLFIIEHKIIDGIDYSAKVDIGLGYKIIRFVFHDEPEFIKVGTIFMEENMSNFRDMFIKEEENQPNEEIVSGESGDEVIKITTFGENFEDTIYIEGIEESVFVKEINSKLGYSMDYYYELFSYAGFENYDTYTWNLTSGDFKAVMTIQDVSDEEIYEDSLDKIGKDKKFEEISGDSAYEKLYYKSFEENEIAKVNYIYYIYVNDLRFMIDLSYVQEAEEGIGIYMRKMITTIK